MIHASPCGNPLLKVIISDVSIPSKQMLLAIYWCFVLTSNLVFHLLINCRIATPNHRGNR